MTSFEEDLPEKDFIDLSKLLKVNIIRVIFHNRGNDTIINNFIRDRLAKGQSHIYG